jgi:hypothetical protein
MLRKETIEKLGQKTHGDGEASRISIYLGIDCFLGEMIREFTDTWGSESWTGHPQVKTHRLLFNVK